MARFAAVNPLQLTLPRPLYRWIFGPDSTEFRQPTFLERLEAIEHRRSLVAQQVHELREQSSLESGNNMADDPKNFMSQDVVQFRLQRIEETMAEMAKDVRSLRESNLANQQLPAEAAELRRRVEVLEKIVTKVEGASWFVRVLWVVIGGAVIAALLKWWSIVGHPTSTP